MENKYRELEGQYYPIVDELEQKLFDLDGININLIPDFTLREFSFVKDWQEGYVDSQYVLSIITTFDKERVAKDRLTRKLSNYMLMKHQKDAVLDYITPVRALIETHAVPLYVTYLNMMEKFFTKVTDLEKNQMKVTWIEQVTENNRLKDSSVHDMTINQVIRQIQTEVMPYNINKYFIGSNIIIFDERLVEKNSTHWIFAPAEYVDILKKEFKVYDFMDISLKDAYIKDMIKAHLNEA